MNRLALSTLAMCLAPALVAAAPPPNIVIVFVDDLGYGDVERFETPNIDALAAAGTTFTDFSVAQPVCSASRAALLTGCYPNRIGINGALGPGARHGLHDRETTIAELCRTRGYATAVFGKWHLGHLPEFLPTRHGFDTFYGIPYSNDMWPLHPDYVDLPPDTAGRKRGFPDLTIFEDERIFDTRVTQDDQRQFTESITARAVAFVEANRNRPFLLYVPHPMPHVPLFVSPPFDGRSGRGLYGDVVSELDASLGRIMTALRRTGVWDNTLVMFISDNGPWLSYGDHGGTTGPLREGKGTTFEGGVRVPCVMAWPGVIPAGRRCDVPLMTIDLLPTIAGFVGASLPLLPIDGRDAGAVLRGDPGAAAPQEAYAYYYHRNDLEAVRSGRWKLHFPHRFRSMEGRTPGTGGTPGHYDRERRTGLELYDLESDIGETTDVAAMHPEVVERLSAIGDRFRSELGDTLTEITGAGVRKPGRVSEPKAETAKPTPGSE